MTIQSIRTYILKIRTYLICFLPLISLEIWWQNFILLTIKRSIFPAAFSNLNWPVSNVLVVHLLEGIEEIFWILEWHKPISFCFTDSFVLNHFCHLEWIVLVSEHWTQYLVCYFITQVTYKDSIIILGPFFKSVIFPNETCNFSQCYCWLLFLFLVFLYPFCFCVTILWALLALWFRLFSFIFRLSIGFLDFLLLRFLGWLGFGLLCRLFLFGSGNCIDEFVFIDIFVFHHQ